MVARNLLTALKTITAMKKCLANSFKNIKLHFKNIRSVVHINLVSGLGKIATCELLSDVKRLDCYPRQNLRESCIHMLTCTENVKELYNIPNAKRVDDVIREQVGTVKQSQNKKKRVQ